MLKQIFKTQYTIALAVRVIMAVHVMHLLENFTVQCERIKKANNILPLS